MTKVTMNLGGKTVEAEKMEFTPVSEPWANYRLVDGTVVKIKIIVQDVYKLPTVDPLTGVPQFLVRSSNVVAVEPPTPQGDVH